jgi:TRAP transporter TAXI family solute receptor
MRRLSLATFFSLMGMIVCWSSAHAAAESRVEQANKGTVGIMTGEFGGSDVRIAADLAAVLDEGNILRVLPILGQGSLKNVNDLFYLRGIDMAIVQSDALTFVKQQQLYPNLDQRMNYVTKLYGEELHIITRQDITDVYGLQSKRVNFVSEDSGDYVTGQLLFQSFGITVEPAFYDTALAIEKIKNGELDATVLVTGKPAAQVASIGADDGLHLLPISLSQVSGAYEPAQLLPEDYPALIEPGSVVDTIGVETVLVVYNWQQDNWRYAKVARFVDAFLGRFDEFLESPRDPKWREVDISATVDGWNRFGPVENWLSENDVAPPSSTTPPESATVANAEPTQTAPAPSQAAAVSKDPSLRRAFREFLADQSTLLGAEALSELDRDELFDRFIQWQRQRSIQSRNEPRTPTF